MSRSPAGVLVSTITASSYENGVVSVTPVGLKLTSKTPLPWGAARKSAPSCGWGSLALSGYPPAGTRDVTRLPVVIVSDAEEGDGDTRTSTYTSVTAGLAPTVAAFCPSPPTTLIWTRVSVYGRPVSADSVTSQNALMLANSRCFFTVPYSKCCVSIAVIAGLRYLASLAEGAAMVSRDGLACSLMNSLQPDTSFTVYTDGVSRGSTAEDPPAKLRRARISCAR